MGQGDRVGHSRDVFIITVPSLWKQAIGPKDDPLNRARRMTSGSKESKFSAGILSYDKGKHECRRPSKYVYKDLVLHGKHCALLCHMSGV